MEKLFLLTADEAITKFASIKKSAVPWGPLLAGAFALPATYFLGKEIYNDVTMPGRLEKSKKEMYDFYPVLAQYKKEDVNKYFDSLAQITPRTASSPALAGSFVRKALEVGGIDPREIVEMQKIEAGGVSGRVPEIGKAFGEGIAQATGKQVAGLALPFPEKHRD